MERLGNALYRSICRIKNYLGRPKIKYFDNFIDCVPTNYNYGNSIELGGFKETGDLSFLIAKKDIPPQYEFIPGQMIEYSGKQYRIIDVVYEPTKEIVRVHVVLPNVV